MSHARSRLLVLASVVLLSGIVSSCGGGTPAADTVDVSGSTTTTVAGQGPVYPLTGLPVTDPAAAARVALVVKIDNHPDSRPQSGLNKADVVFEENVEGLTRFAAVFHSQGSDPVGPIRSGRTQDVDILSAYNKPLFGWSGGNWRVTRVINRSELVNVGHSASKGKGGYFRSKDRKMPHNLYSKTSVLWTLAPEGSGPPQTQFIYRGLSDAKPSTSVAVDGCKISMFGVKVYWKWDAQAGRFVRFTEKKLDWRKYVLEEHMSDGEQVNAQNVVIINVTYKRSEADRKSPHAVTIGSGVGSVLTDGGMIPVKWERADRKSPFTLTDANGAVVRLTPGRTWVELASKGSVAQVDPGVDPMKVAWPAI